MADKAQPEKGEDFYHYDVGKLSLCVAAAHHMVKAIQICLFSVQNPCGDTSLFKVRNCCLIDKPRMLGQLAGNLLAEHDLCVYEFVQRFAML